MSIKVLIIDDHALMREGIRLLLESQTDIEVVGEASSSTQGLELLRSCLPDVVLLDVGLPGMSGLEMIELIRSIAPQTEIVMLSRHEKEAYVHQALNAGARGYVVKGDPSSQLLEAIRAVMQGRYYLGAGVNNSVITSYLKSGQTEHQLNEPFEQLSDREKQVFMLLVQGNSSNQIAELLCISSKTVDKHRANIAKKIGIDNPVKMVQFAFRKGIIDPSFWEE